MKLSEKIYSLRKERGLSQERLAEELNVSRQAVSKWENGTSFPEHEMLVTISSYFGVSVDYLVKDGKGDRETPLSHTAKNPAAQRQVRIGLLLSVLGGALLIFWGILIFVDPTGLSDIAATSTVTLDGRGILLLLFCAMLATGVFLLLKKRK